MPIQGFAGSELLTADGAINSAGRKVRIFSMHIISGGTAGVVNLRDGDAVTDTIRVTETGAVNTGRTINFGEWGILFENGCFYDEDANVTSTLITYATEN